MLAHLCDPSTQEAETGALGITAMDEQVAGCGLHSVLVVASNSAPWAQGLSDKTRMQSGRSLEPNRLHLLVRYCYLPLEDTSIVWAKLLLS